MKNLTLVSQDNKEVMVRSEDIRNMIESFEGVHEARDISEGMNEDVLGYEIILNINHIEEMLKDEMEDLEFSLDDEEAQEIFFEQAEYIGDALVDSLKEFIEDRYKLEGFQTAYNVNRVSINDGIALTLTLSFGKLGHGKLYELASSINHKPSELR